MGLDLPSTGSRWPFPTGAIWVHASTSFGVIGYPSYGNRRVFLPLMLSADYSFDPHWSLGGYLGYFSIAYDDSYLGERYSSRLSNWVLGGRLTFHGTDVINELTGADIDVTDWDIYGILSLGLVNRTWRVDSDYRESRNFDSITYPSLGLVVGAKYFVSNTFAIHAELGKGALGALTFGGSLWIK